ncbi:hypothetical protein GH740_03130 [Microbacterium sp. SYP-A9085]|uniref:hypothetical protein n=1 Tax=Microbacterium sp. SYP-A9085 TaxID=2664454 RepID=UPI00129BEF3C|nr:hypothetical protein [Microbacterium sp. SYP-A9085]MRH28307.1 hypothetical protein [Microbacterium sp. SYP-A9085]
MMIAEAEIAVRGATGPDDLQSLDQDIVDEVFFAIIRRSFPQRTAACPTPPPAFVADLLVRDRPRRRFTGNRGVPRARVRSPPARRPRAR